MIVLQSKVRDVHRLLFSPTGRALAASAGSNHLLVWRDLLAGRPPAEVAGVGRWSVRRWAFLPDGGRLVVCHGWSRQTRALDLDTLTWASPANLPAGVSWFHFTERGGFVLVPHGKADLSRLDLSADGSGAFVPAWTVRHVRQWHRIWTIEGDICRAGSRFIGIEYTYRHDQKQRFQCRLVARSTADGAVEGTAKWSSRYALRQTTLSPSGDRLVFVVGMVLYVHDLTRPTQPPLRVLNDNRKHFTDVAFHPSGRYLAATSNDATVKLYDTQSWQVARLFSWEIGRLGAVAFSPDGCQGAAGSDTGKVVVWDVDL
jgi:WD40 repeat protein